MGLNILELQRKGYGLELLPIIPPNAEISAKSLNKPRVEEQRGKIPGLKRKDGWVGFGQWTEHETSPADYETWNGWGGGVGLRARKFPAFDLDISDEPTAARFALLIERKIGRITPRVGRRPRILIPTRAVGFAPTKRFVHFTLPGSDEKQIIELLGDGQQYVVSGVHPKTGNEYHWPRGVPQADALPALSEGALDTLWAEIIQELGAIGATIVSRREGAGGAASEGYALEAPSLDVLTQIVKAIPIADITYDDWIACGNAIKAAGGEEAYGLFEDWSLDFPESTVDYIDEKWATFRPPFRIGFRYLLDKAAAAGLNTTVFDFEAQGDVDEEADDPETFALKEMFERYVWVDDRECAFDRRTRTLVSRLQFNVRNNHIADPSSRDNSAWAIWLRDASALQKCKALTYRPGLDEIVQEAWGKCYNTWTPSTLAPAAGDPSLWLDHVAYILPDEREREIFLDWLAALVQHQNRKLNWHVVLCGMPGTGKDALLLPVIATLGQQNTRIVLGEQIVHFNWTDWYENARLLVVEEMATFGRRDVENKLKAFLTDPPDRVPIAKRNTHTYEVPNIGNFLFFSNHETALQISRDDRRYFVVHSPAEPKSEDYYATLFDWLRDAGAAIVAHFLLTRKIAINLKGRAPDTDAKTHMQDASLTPLEEWILDGINDKTGPFKHDLIDVAELFHQLPKSVKWEHGTVRRLAVHLRKAGARFLERIRFKDKSQVTGSDRGNLYSLRNHQRYASLSSGDLAIAYKTQQERAEREELGAEFDAVSGANAFI